MRAIPARRSCSPSPRCFSAGDGRVDDAKIDAQRATDLIERLSDAVPWYEAEVRVALARSGPAAR
jgi:hypothetical protein